MQKEHKKQLHVLVHFQQVNYFFAKISLIEKGCSAAEQFHSQTTRAEACYFTSKSASGRCGHYTWPIS